MFDLLAPAASLLWPSAAHLALTAFLYLWLTIERAAAVLARAESAHGPEDPKLLRPVISHAVALEAVGDVVGATKVRLPPR